MTKIDTAAEATAGDDLIAAVIRGWSIERKSRAHARLTALVRASSRRAWCERHPEQSSCSANIGWAESIYGADIGRALRQHFQDHP